MIAFSPLSATCTIACPVGMSMCATLRRAIDGRGHIVDLGLKAIRETMVTRAILPKVIDEVRFRHLDEICTDKTSSKCKAIQNENRRFGPQLDRIAHTDNKQQNKPTESDPAALRKVRALEKVSCWSVQMEWPGPTARRLTYFQGVSSQMLAATPSCFAAVAAKSSPNMNAIGLPCSAIIAWNSGFSLTADSAARS